MNFPKQIFFNDFNHSYRAAILKKHLLWPIPFYMVVATYLYYEKVHTIMRTAIVSNLLKQFTKWCFTLYTLILQKKKEDDTFLINRTGGKIVISVDGKRTVFKRNWNYRGNRLNKDVNKLIPANSSFDPSQILILQFPVPRAPLRPLPCLSKFMLANWNPS